MLEENEKIISLLSKEVSHDICSFFLNIFNFNLIFIFFLLFNVVLPDFAEVYNFIGSVFDPNITGHVQKLKRMDPIDVETVRRC